MRVHVVSDVHRNVDALARAADGADALIVLGDLIEAVDYTDPSRGIMGELFGADATALWIELRTAGRFAEAGAHSRHMLAEAAAARGCDPRDLLRTALREQYAEIFAAMPTPALCTYGNVDDPSLWPEFARSGVRILDGEVAEVGGVRVGFVGGGVSVHRRGYPYLITESDFARKLAALGAVDVLCTHIPPRVPELCYDVVARRFELGADAIRAFLVEHEPALHLFGHVHQPLHPRMRIGRTECINVGHFRETGTPFAVELARSPVAPSREMPL